MFKAFHHLPIGKKKTSTRCSLLFQNVIASTREVDLNHPAFHLLRGKNEKLLAASETFFERSAGLKYSDEELKDRVRSAAPDRRFEILLDQVLSSVDEQSKNEIEKTVEFTKMTRELIRNFKTKASEFGINPNHNDKILYFDDTLLVAKKTVDDGIKLKSKLDNFFQNMPLMSRLKYKEINVWNEKWSVFSMISKNQLDLEILKRMRADFMKVSDPEAVKKFENDQELGFDDDDSYVKNALIAAKTIVLDTIDSNIKELEELLKYKDNDADFPYNLRIAIHFDRNVITALLLTDETQLVTYNRVLKPALKPMNKSKLGAVQPNVMAIGFMDNVKGIDRLLKSDVKKFLSDGFDIELGNLCDDEIKAIVADYPRVSFVTRVDGNNKITMDSIFTLKDKESIKKFRISIRKVSMFSPTELCWA